MILEKVMSRPERRVELLDLPPSRGSVQHLASPVKSVVLASYLPFGAELLHLFEDRQLVEHRGHHIACQTIEHLDLGL